MPRYYYDGNDTGPADFNDSTVAFYAHGIQQPKGQTPAQERGKFPMCTNCTRRQRESKDPPGSGGLKLRRHRSRNRNLRSSSCLHQQATRPRRRSLPLRHPSGTASAQHDADAWANRYRLSDPVLHCGGNTNSDLRELVSRFALANGCSTPGYPTSVLVDPDGVIRYFQLGVDFTSLESHLMQYSHQSWPLYPG